jgi:hypothetical protein
MSDEIYHWHQAATFARAGFDGGYYSVNEKIAPAAFSHFYTWGAFAPAFYGTLAWLMGWSLSSYVLLNALLLTVAIVWFVYVVDASLQQMAWLAIVLTTFLPIALYLPTNMQQLLHLSIALVISAGFYRQIKVADPPTFYATLPLFIFISLAALVRPTWALFLLPAFLLSSRNRSKTFLVLGGLIAAGITVALASLFHSTAAPYPRARAGASGGHLRGELFAALDSSMLGAINMLFQQLFGNIATTIQGPAYIAGQRVLLLAMLAAFGAIALGGRRRRALSQLSEHWVTREAAFHVYNLASIYLATMTLHETFRGRDYRVLAPHVLLSVALAVGFRRQWIASATAVSMLMMTPSALVLYGSYSQYHRDGPKRVEMWKVRLGDKLAYDPLASDPWCNTLLHSLDYFEFEPALLSGIDPGIGLSWLDRRAAPESFASRYLILTHSDFAQFGKEARLRPLLPVPGGVLYVNLDRDCSV